MHVSSCINPHHVAPDLPLGSPCHQPAGIATCMEGGIRHLLGGLWNLAGNASGGWTGWTGWMARTMTYSLESGGVNLGAVCVEDV